MPAVAAYDVLAFDDFRIASFAAWLSSKRRIVLFSSSERRSV
jgi:hypothetical protein